MKLLEWIYQKILFKFYSKSNVNTLCSRCSLQKIYTINALQIRINFFSLKNLNRTSTWAHYYKTLLSSFFFFTDLDNVEGIAVDWIGNNLYWTNDGHRKTINVARLEKASQSRKTLLEGEMSHPRGIVVDPVNGYALFNQLIAFNRIFLYYSVVKRS